MAITIKLPPPIHFDRTVGVSLESFVADYAQNVQLQILALARKTAQAGQAIREEWEDLLTPEEKAPAFGKSEDEMAGKFMQLANVYAAYRLQYVIPETDIAKAAWMFRDRGVENTCNFDPFVSSFVEYYGQKSAIQMIQKITSIVDEFLDKKFPYTRELRDLNPLY